VLDIRFMVLLRRWNDSCFDRRRERMQHGDRRFFDSVPGSMLHDYQHHKRMITQPLRSSTQAAVPVPP
jgi:hypothetical protein